MAMTSRPRQLLTLSVAVAVAAGVGVGAANSSFAAAKPAAPVTARAHAASGLHQRTFTLDHVALKVSSPDLPSGSLFTAAPGTGVQVASVTQDSPFRYFSVTTVPYGEQLPESAFPVSRAGDTAAWRAALHSTQTGPVATLFGQKVKGLVLHSQGDLTARKGSVTRLETVQWIVDQGGRTWVFTLQRDQAGLSTSFGTDLQISSADSDAKTSVDLAKPGASAPTPLAVRSNAVGLGGTLGQPSWWNSTCDGNGSLLNTQIMGLQVCGGGSSRLESSIPGVGQYEWQCAELSDRYLVQRYGFNGLGGNGNQETDNAYNAHPSLFDLYANGDHTPPTPGDVISFNVGADALGHTGVVYQSDVDSSGNGTVYFVDQNWTGDGGYHSAAVSDWNVADITGEGGTVHWLHNPADSLVSNPSSLPSGTLVKDPDNALVKVIVDGAGLPLTGGDVTADGYKLSSIVAVTDASFNALSAAPPNGIVLRDASGSNDRYAAADGVALYIGGGDWTADGYSTQSTYAVPSSWLAAASAASLPDGSVLRDASGSNDRYAEAGGAALYVNGGDWTADGYSTQTAYAVPSSWLAAQIAKTVPNGSVLRDASGTNDRYAAADGAALHISSSDWTTDGYSTLTPLAVPSSWLAGAVTKSVPNETVLISAAGGASRYLMVGGEAVYLNDNDWTTEGFESLPTATVPGAWLATADALTAPADGTLIEGKGDPDIYLVTGGQKELLNSSQFGTGGYNTNNIVTVPTELITTLPTTTAS
jgi:CHAP domain